MSRPVLPTFSVPGWTIPVWAPDTNYAAGSDPWSGLATKVAHPGAGSVGIVPRTAVAAQVLNKLVHDAYATDEDAKDHATTLTSELQTFAGNVLAFAGQIQALNWHTKSSEIVDSSRIAWDPNTRRWVTVGGTDVFKISYDNGLTWIAITPGATTSSTLTEIIIDSSGNYAVIGSGGKTLDYQAGTSTWTYHASGLGYSPVNPRGVWAASDSLFCLIDRDVGGTAQIYTSPTGATWTSRTAPSNFAPSSADLYRICYGNGRVVIACHTGTTTVKTAYSDDGGVTWSNGTTCTIGFTSNGTDSMRIAYNEGAGKWIMTVSYSGIAYPSRSTEVWTSADGATFTKVVTLAGGNVRALASCGCLTLAVYDLNYTVSGEGGYLAYTLDGVTWKKAGRLGTGTTGGIVGEVCKQFVANPHQFLALVASSTPANAYVYSSLSCGEGSSLT